MKHLTLRVRLAVVLALALAPAMALAAVGAWEKFETAAAAARLLPQAVSGTALSSATQALWIDSVLLLLAFLAALVALSVAAQRWCLRPLRPIQEAAAAFASGNFTPPRPTGSMTPEMAALTSDIFSLGAAIGAREADLRASLQQREHMLREIHHRVKNNLQMILSLLNLQADKVRSPRVLRLFGDAQNRVLALSILHQHLYERSDWSSVDFQAYITDLVSHLSARRSRRDKPAVHCTVRASVMSVGPDTAIPIGLIVTEAVSNAFSHAFVDAVSPEVRISADEIDGEILVAIVDNGSGLGGTGEVLEGRQLLGITLMRGLAGQLGGSLDMAASPGGGTRVELRFPKPRPQIGNGLAATREAPGPAAG
ncbi:MAG: sensor histidine kinase [Reyranella sp.]|nr:sensor histidine kinase [Reyranella sp.]